MEKARFITSVLLICLVGVLLFSGTAFALVEFQDSFEYNDWAGMSAAGWVSVKNASDTNIQFQTSASTPPITPVKGDKVVCFNGVSQPVVAKDLTQIYGNCVFKCSWYYNPSEGRDPVNGYITLKDNGTATAKYVMIRANTVDTATNRRFIAVRWNSATAINIGLFKNGWNDFKIVYEPVPDTALSTVSIYLNGVLTAQKTNFDIGGGLGRIEIGRTWANNPGYNTVFDNLSVSSAGHYIKPFVTTVTAGGTQQFAFDTTNENKPVTWQVVEGVGSIDSNGLFSAGLTPGTSRIRATDLAGNTDEIVINVVKPVIDPKPASVVLGTAAPFAFTNAVGAVTWAVQNESGGTPGSVGTIDASGVFTPVALGTCEVTASDALGNTDVSSVTVIGNGTYGYTPDINTLALYHLDEGAGQNWYDSSINNLTGATLVPSIPLYHVPGYFGNAASGFRTVDGNYTCINVPPTAALNAEELTAEAWIKTGTDTTGGTVGHTIVSRRGPDSWGLSIGAYGTYGVAGQLTFIWWPLNAETTLTSKDFNSGAGLSLSPDTWYHVAVTFKRITNTNPKPTYEVKLYCTQQGEITPVEVASKTTTYALNQNSGWLRIGCEQDYRRTFPGLIDEVRISSRARTPEELLWTLGANPAGKVADPQITPAGGVQTFPLNATITCATAGATIYYTTDGIDPTQSSKVYNGTPISVGPNMTVKAMACKSGLISSYAKATYTLPTLNRPQAILYSDAVTIDGSLSEWADAEWAPLDQVFNVDGSTAALLQADIPEAYYAVKWGDNGNKLYVAVKVKDTSIMFTDDYAGWNMRDAVEFYIHTTGNGPINYSTVEVPALTSAQQYSAGFRMDMSTLWSSIGANNFISEDSFRVGGTIQYVEGTTWWLNYEAAITPYHSFSLNGSLPNQISTLSAGQTIGFDVVAVGNNGAYTGMKAENMLTGKWDDYTKFAPHLLMTAPTTTNSIAEAKTAVNGSVVTVSGIVSAKFTDYFYVESADRTYGIRVNKANHGRSVGEAVNVTGFISTLPSTERYILAVSVAVNGGGQIDPLGMTNKALGGSDFGTLPNGQSGVINGAGVNNIGLFVTITGKVGLKGTNWFMIDDGSGVGVKVYGTVPATTPYVSVKGISSCEKDSNNAVQRVLLATSILENVQ